MSSGFRSPGAGPQLKVVSAPAFDRLPVAAKGLGVVTDLPVAKVTLSTLAPTSPQPGDVWFEMGRFAQAVTINTRPEVLVAPQDCYQFDGVWSRREGFCAINKAWAPLRKYLYINGTVVTEIATSILSGTNNGGSRSDGADGITISAQKSSDQWSRHMTIYSPIVFAGYKKICAEWMALANYTVGGPVAVICALATTGNATISTTTLAKGGESLTGHPAGQVFEMELDISDVSDNFRAAVGISTDSSSAASVKLTKLWLL